MQKHSRADQLLEGLNKLLRLHNEVFNESLSEEESKVTSNWTVAWPEEYRVMRSILMQNKLIGEPRE